MGSISWVSNPPCTEYHPLPLCNPAWPLELHSAPLAQHEQKIAKARNPPVPDPALTNPPHCHHRKRGSKTDWPLADKTALKPDMSDAGTYLDRIRTGKRRSQRRRLQRGTASAAMRMPLWSCFDLQAVWGQ